MYRHVFWLFTKTISVDPYLAFYVVDVMPVVIVEMWEGRTAEQKKKLIEGITKAFEGLGVKPEWLHIIIHDVPRTNWGTRGRQASETGV
ncbi:hypothetical protein B6U79_00715 [Candidatus Bathyarchaeota archaeon ex4484_231]|nr:MAG: hypothetical protein B6U79_00715 [Candidatus Bathyarchaeota archaeon ex4484_231]